MTLKYDPHYAWSGFGGAISTAFPHATACLSPMLEGVPTKFYDTGLQISLYQTLKFDWWPWRVFSPHLIQGPKA
jgi:hypothetical protein